MVQAYGTGRRRRLGDRSASVRASQAFGREGRPTRRGFLARCSDVGNRSPRGVFLP